MLDVVAWRGDTTIASFLRLGQWLVLVAFALHMHAPAFALQTRLPLAIDVTFIGVDVAAGIGELDHRFEVQGIALVGSADLDLAYEFVTLVGAG